MERSVSTEPATQTGIGLVIIIVVIAISISISLSISISISIVIQGSGGLVARPRPGRRCRRSLALARTAALAMTFISTPSASLN